MSLPRCRILRSRADFARVREKGQAKPGRFLLVTSLEVPEAGESMYGFITPKYVGKAHERNLVRRRLRAMVRSHWAELVPGRWVVVVARRAVSQADFTQLEAEFLKLARKAGLWTGALPKVGDQGGGN